MRAVAACLVLLLAPISLSAFTRARFLMGTVCEIEASDERQITAAFDECARIEAMLSTWRSESELSRLNADPSAPVSAELLALLDRVTPYTAATGGGFDPICGARRPCPTHQRTLSGRREAIDEGGFGKGYALDRMLAMLGGDAVINFGGQLAVRGRATVTIADPRRRDTPVVETTISGGSLSTSSDSEQGGHIFDPRSGRPVTGRGSASVLDPSALRADILSTALYVMGPLEGLRWADAHDVAAVFITADDTILISRAFRLATRDTRVTDPKFKLKDE
jgi:thiamine biosynthesis lipoprotein